MKKIIITTLLTLFSSQLFAADKMGIPVLSDLICEGEHSEKPNNKILLEVISTQHGTTYTSEKFGFESSKYLTAGSEGDVFIQQYETGYNFLIQGKELDYLFKQNQPTTHDDVILSGSLHYEGIKYNLTCYGLLGLNQWPRSN